MHLHFQVAARGSRLANAVNRADLAPYSWGHLGVVWMGVEACIAACSMSNEVNEVRVRPRLGFQFLPWLGCAKQNMRLADCRRRDLFWKPRRARAAGCPMQSCKPLLRSQGWLLPCRDCGFSRGELGTQNPTHPFILAAFAIAACWGSNSKAWTHGSWPGLAVIKIWLKREILTAALRPATWDSPRAPGNDPGERVA